ncbi:hypothetical protein BDAP_001784 [Binucleata daphniae]
MEVYKYTKLANNLQIITKTLQSGIATNLLQQNNTNTLEPGLAIINMFVKTGSQHENKKINGISHFIEHLFIGSLNLKDANVNGHTTKEMTSYIFKQQNVNFRENLSKILHNLKKPNFLKKTINDKIKKIELENIKNEIEDVKKNKLETKIENEHSVFDAKYKALQLPILGKINTLSGLSSYQIKNHYDKNYTNNNVLFIVESKFSHECVVKTFCEILDRISVVVDGYENDKYIKYMIIKEMFNQKNMKCFYLPYKENGLFSYKYKDVDFDRNSFKITKSRILQSLNATKKNQMLLTEEVAYHKLYLNKIYNIDTITTLIKKLEYLDVIKTINTLLGKNTVKLVI